MSVQPETLHEPSAPPATLQDFFDRLGHVNPFAANRVLQPSPDDADAGGVHQAAFARLVELARMAHDQRLGVGAVVWGVAGVGKSHLLSRLWRWAEGRRACFVYLQNLQADPARLAPYVLKVVVSVLTRGREDRWRRTALFSVLNAAIKKGLEEDGVTGPAKWYQIEEVLNRLMDPAAGRSPAALADPTVRDVLARFYRFAHPHSKARDEGAAALAVQWLSGEPLDADQARRIGVPGRDTRGDDQHARDVLVALSQAATGRGQPVVLCFDQVDNLSEAQAAALMRFLQALLDSAPNLLVVNAGVQATLMKWHADRVIQESSWDRIAQFEISLQRVNADEARQIVEARLERFLEPFREIDQVREQIDTDALFPLGRRRYARHLEGRVDLRPRDVISRAREGWQREQKELKQSGGAAWLENWETRAEHDSDDETVVSVSTDDLIDRAVDQRLQEQMRQRELHPETLPPSADNLSELVFNLLRHCQDRGAPYNLLDLQRVPRRKVRPRPPYHLEVRQQLAHDRALDTGVFFVVAQSAKATFHQLEAVVNDPDPPEHCLLVTDQRSPLKLGAGGEELLGQLRGNARRGFRAFELEFSRYAELDALQAVIGLAVSGDLEIALPGGNPRRVTEQEVIESHHRRGRFLAHPLLRLLAGGTAAAKSAGHAEGVQRPRQDEQLGELVTSYEPALRRFVMAQVALARHVTTRELAPRCVQYLETAEGVRSDLALVEAGLWEVASRMSHDGLIEAAPADGGLALSAKQA